MMKPSLLERLEPGRLVALVGGGGKTTTGERLVMEAAASGRRALLTTTTKTYARAPFPVRLFASAREAAAVLESADLPALVARQGPTAEKLAGFEAGEIPALLGAADLVVVEADGARRLPIKAFGPGEPVLPPGVDDYVIVIGLAALGRAIEPGAVHRPERLREVLDVPAGTRLTEDLVARAVVAPGGYLSAAPAGAQVSVLLLGADSPERRAASERLAAAVLADSRVGRAIAGDLRDAGAGLKLFMNASARGDSRGASGATTPSRERE